MISTELTNKKTSFAFQRQNQKLCHSFFDPHMAKQPLTLFLLQPNASD